MLREQRYVKSGGRRLPREYRHELYGCFSNTMAAWKPRREIYPSDVIGYKQPKSCGRLGGLVSLLANGQGWHELRTYYQALASDRLYPHTQSATHHLR